MASFYEDYLMQNNGNFLWILMKEGYMADIKSPSLR